MLVASKTGGGPWVGPGNVVIENGLPENQELVTIADVILMDEATTDRRFMWLSFSLDSLP